MLSVTNSMEEIHFWLRPGGAFDQTKNVSKKPCFGLRLHSRSKRIIKSSGTGGAEGGEMGELPPLMHRKRGQSPISPQL